MSFKNPKNSGQLLIIMLCGIVIGGFIGKYAGDLPYMGFLKFGETFGLSSPVILDLGIMTLTLGFSFTINIAGIIGLILGIVAYRKLQVNMKKLILASNSSRRQDILRKAGYSFSVHIAEIDENKYMKGELSAEDTVALLSRLKGEAAVKEITGEYVLLSADTIVVHENRIIGKPESPEDAFHILKSLCSKCHKVYTAVTIFNVDHENIDVIPILDSSDVYMGDLNDGEIISYINTKEPMDKAGAYGIQGLAGLFVDKIEGDFYNVEGLPLRKVYKELKKLGIYPHAISDQYAY